VPAERLLLPWDSAAGASADIRFHEGWELVDRTVCQRRVDLLVVDSLTGFSVGNENLAEDVSEVLLQLSELARKRGIPVLVIHHLRKHSGSDGREVNLDRVRGSTAITQFCRSVLAVERPDSTQATLRLHQIKNNLGKFVTPLGFRITETGLVFCEAPQPSRKSPQLDAATQFVITALSEGPQWASDLIEEAERAGIRQRTLQRAATDLGVTREKFKEGWACSLPDLDPEEGDDGSSS
jgi:predicted ATP-dependent serine protease